MKTKFIKSRLFWGLIVLLLAIIFGFLSFRPIINPKEEDCTRIEGILEKYQCDENNKDIHIKIENSENSFYINHVFPQEIDTKDLDSLIGEKIIIFAVNHWTLLDPKGKNKHVARITTQKGDKIIYSEY